jgi:hypothetical protein
MALPLAEVPSAPGVEQNAPGVTVPPEAAGALEDLVTAGFDAVPLGLVLFDAALFDAALFDAVLFDAVLFDAVLFDAVVFGAVVVGVNRGAATAALGGVVFSCVGRLGAGSASAGLGTEVGGVTVSGALDVGVGVGVGVALGWEVTPAAGADTGGGGGAGEPQPDARQAGTSRHSSVPRKFMPYVTRECFPRLCLVPVVLAGGQVCPGDRPARQVLPALLPRGSCPPRPAASWPPSFSGPGRTILPLLTSSISCREPTTE